jgi:hypothetical protein
MKNQFLCLLLGLGLLLLTQTANAQGGGVVCPNSVRTTFSTVDASDLSTDGVIAPTTCQRVLVLDAANSFGSSYTTSFSAGTPAPTTLPATLFTNGGPVALGLGQTIVTVTAGTGGSGSCTYTVTLTDDVPPVVDGPRQISAKTTATMPDLKNVVTVAEDCNYTLSQSPAPGSPISGNSIDVTFVATDGSGNASDQFVLTLNLSATTMYDDVTVAAVGGCAGEDIAVTVNNVPSTSGIFVTYQVDNESPITKTTTSSGSVMFSTDAGLTEGIHTVTIISLDEGNGIVFVNKSASAYVGTPQVGLGGLTVNGTLGGGGPITLSGSGTGTSFVFTGPNGYVYSTVFRNPGTYNLIAQGVLAPGTYTLTANTLPSNCDTGSPPPQR